MTPIARPLVTVLCAALAGLAIAACASEPAAPPTPPSIELRSYAMAPAQASELRGVIDRLLSGSADAPRLGRAAIGPGGGLIVSATPAVHAGIEQLVAGLERNPPAQAAVVELTYWLVEGRPAEASSTPPALAVVKPALDAITAADGPRAFTLVETLRLRSLGGERGKLEGRQANVEQSASVRGDEVIARIALRHRTGGLETDLALPADTLLVLGQTGAERPRDQTVIAPPADLYYLVRARILSPGTR